MHIAVVFVNGPEQGSTLYVDGVLQTLTCTAGNCNVSRRASGPGPVLLGGGDQFQYRGKLDDVQIYDHALSNADIGHIFDGSVCP